VQGKVVLITGGARRLGAAICRRLHSAGANLIVTTEKDAARLSPSLVVALQNVNPDPVLTVGANVAAGSSKLGTVVDISRVERQSLARYATDGGNNVAIQVYPSATLGVP